MRKVTVLVFLLLLLATVGVATAHPGMNNPNAFVVDVDCPGYFTGEVVVTGSAGHTSIGIGIPRTVYVDGELVFEHPGRGYKTIWCTWTESTAPGVVFSGDVQVAPPG